MKKNLTPPSFLLLLILAGSFGAPGADARGFRRSGPNGAIGARGGAYTGPNGGTFRGGAAGFRTANAGAWGGRFRATGPNGGTGQGSGLAGYKRGVGGFEKTQMSLNGAGGSTYNGFTKGVYNAKSGQGSYNASHQIYDAKNGKNYGDTNQTSYSNGTGVTQLDTNNHGDYTIDWGKGQKPSVVKDPTQ